MNTIRDEKETLQPILQKYKRLLIIMLTNWKIKFLDTNDISKLNHEDFKYQWQVMRINQ
jgi:hypothetical protein